MFIALLIKSESGFAKQNLRCRTRTLSVKTQLRVVVIKDLLFCWEKPGLYTTVERLNVSALCFVKEAEEG